MREVARPMADHQTRTPLYRPETRRYQVAVRSRPGPSSGRGQYLRAVYVAVVDTEEMAGPQVRDEAVVCSWGRRGRCLDSRYTGPRSAYSRALADAQALADSLNRRWEIRGE